MIFRSILYWSFFHIFILKKHLIFLKNHQKSKIWILLKYVRPKKYHINISNQKIFFSELKQLLISLTNHWGGPGMHFRWFYRILKIHQKSSIFHGFSRKIPILRWFVLFSSISNNTRQNFVTSTWFYRIARKSAGFSILKRKGWESPPESSNDLNQIM